MGDAGFGPRVEAVRRFSRFYSQHIGMLNEGLLKSPFSLSEARIIYELAQREQTSATALATDLGLDAGYLSRMLSSFQKRSLITKQPSETDGRRSVIRLAQQGQDAFALLNARSHSQVAALLSELSTADQDRLVAAMGTVEELLGARSEQRAPYLLRPPQPGDMGWVVQRHGVLYAKEYSWNEEFEALVASIVAEFVRHFDSKRERCWIAERNGVNVGSVFLVKKSDTEAKLRLLLVEPTARGLGIGSRLVDECVRFAKQTGYAKLVLWTNSVLLGARHIYREAGFRLVESEPQHSFGHDLVFETWELEL